MEVLKERSGNFQAKKIVTAAIIKITISGRLRIHENIPLNKCRMDASLFNSTDTCVGSHKLLRKPYRPYGGLTAIFYS